MFGSTILDVAIGMIFSFLAVSLFTSATVEAINSLLQLRAVNLKSGIMALVNDPRFAGLAKKLYEHALISPLGPGLRQPPAAAAPQGPALRGSHNRVVFDWRTVGASDSTLLRFLGGVDGRWFLRRYSSFSSI
jgi:hypothetical protein